MRVTGEAIFVIEKDVPSLLLHLSFVHRQYITESPEYNHRDRSQVKHLFEVSEKRVVPLSASHLYQHPPEGGQNAYANAELGGSP